MVEYETKIRHWGNSFGVIVPKKKLEKENLRENQMVRVIVRPIKRLMVRDIFGKLKKWKRPTREIMGLVDKDLDSKFLGE